MNSNAVAKYLMIFGVVMLIAAVSNLTGGQTVWAENNAQEPPCVPGTIPCPTPTPAPPTPTAMPSAPTPTPAPPANPGGNNLAPTPTVQPAVVDSGNTTPTNAVTPTLVSAPTTLPETGNSGFGWWIALVGIASLVAGIWMRFMSHGSKTG